MYYVEYTPHGDPYVMRNDGARMFPDSADWLVFTAWNAQQPVPLDYSTPITPPGPTPEEVTAKANESTLLGKLVDEVQEIRAFRDSGALWSTVNANQKDQLIGRLLKNVEWLARLLARKLDKAD